MRNRGMIAFGAVAVLIALLTLGVGVRYVLPARIQIQAQATPSRITARGTTEVTVTRCIDTGAIRGIRTASRGAGSVSVRLVNDELRINDVLIEPPPGVEPFTITLTR